MFLKEINMLLENLCKDIKIIMGQRYSNSTFIYVFALKSCMV